ncbi:MULTISPECIES: hypothetical protein [Mycobacteriaceae]|uniref:Uncharacterized protein n=1 Tax=Mycolicibacterium nivoides TaxID=2487344 RepID=A0ABW9LNE3_9MYCO|nr:hypothetical protein [Mycobacterium syngnathidarum]
MTYRLEIDDHGDSESSDTVTVYGPDDSELSDYDSCAHADEEFIAEAKHELGGL